MKHIIKVEVLENLPEIRPLIAMDANGKLICEPKLDGTKIWYTTTDGKIYDLKGIIEMIVGKGGTYNGPAIVSNEYDAEKQMWCMSFDRDVTVVGDVDANTMTAEGPIFATLTDMGLVCNVETIILPKTVERIGVGTFYGCSGLTSITIPNSVTSIGDGALYGCSSLTSVTINSDAIVNKAYTYSSNLSNIFGSQVTEYIIGDNVKGIGDYAFCICDSLTSVTIGNNVSNIGYGAFAQCSALTSTVIPNSVTSIGELAFGGCTSLTSMTIPNSVTSIGDMAFAECSSLTSIVIPNSVTNIGMLAFFNVLNIEYHGSATGSPWGAKYINGYVEGNLAYQDSTKTNLVVCRPSAVDIIIPSSVVSIGNSAFNNCSKLTSVTIPNSVTSIGNYAFQYCESLTSITIPNSVTRIGDYAFWRCSGMMSIVCNALMPPTLGGSDVFDNTNNCPIYVPPQSVDEYKVAKYWSEYASRIVDLLNNNQIRYTRSSLLTIKDNVAYTDHTFENGVGVVTFDNDITAIPLYWFTNIFVEFGEAYDGNLLTSLTLPNGISSINMGALLFCADTVYYEGTQKECARISKDVFDGSGAGFYHCFDGIVSDKYNSNIITPFYLALAPWLRELLGDEVFSNFIITMSVKIDEHPMTAGEFITMLVNGIEGIIALSTYGFTVVNQEIQGITIPLAYHTESGHFIGIAKATDCEHGGLSEASYIAPVAVNESLDPDYMYMLLDDTITQAS